MTQWYHSGIEGYCKATARMMGLPDNNSGWGNFGRDLFADGRFDDPVKASKTWTLSRFRKQGRSNRPALFENSWLGKNGVEYDIDAIHACARSICSAETDSALGTLYQDNYLTFASGFRSTVLPAIEDGFHTERYHSADIARFSQGMDTLLGELNPSLPQTFRNFVVALVAGLVYGPTHVVAQSKTNSATLRGVDKIEKLLVDLPEAETIGIRLTLLLGDNATYTGYSETFDEHKAILFGRNADVEAYLQKCDPVFTKDIEDRELVVFPIANTHRSTSKEHGILAHIGDTWYFHDFSANGSCISNVGQHRSVSGGIAALVPGDILHLGQTEPSEDAEATYRLSTAVLVSFNLNDTVL